MVILGIDPGSSCTGYGVVEVVNSRLVVKGYGLVEVGSRIPFPQRLKAIYEGLTAVIKKYRPDQVAIEDVFHSKNVRTTLVIGQVRGVALLAALNAGVEVAEYSPREVKQAVVGQGSASKGQVQFMVKVICGLEEPPQPSDAADALAVALCHVHRIDQSGKSGIAVTRGKER